MPDREEIFLNSAPNESTISLWGLLSGSAFGIAPL